MTSNATAHSQMSDSFQSAAVKVAVGKKYETACRTTNIPKSARSSPTQVPREIPEWAAGWSVIALLLGCNNWQRRCKIHRLKVAQRIAPSHSRHEDRHLPEFRWQLVTRV